MKIGIGSKKNVERRRYSYLASCLFRFFIRLYIFSCFLFVSSIALAAETQIISTNVTHPNFQLTLQPDPQATTIYLLAGTTSGGSDLTVQLLFPSGGLSVFGVGSTSVNFNISTNIDTVHITVLTIGGNSPQINQPFSTAVNQRAESPLALNSPVDGSLLADKRSIIVWDWPEGIGNGGFMVSVGTSVGAADILSQYFNAVVTDAPIDIELNGSPVYLRIDTSTGTMDSDAGVTNYSVSASYQTATSGVDSGTQMISPASGSTLDTPTTNFQWVADSLASSLLIKTGSSPGMSDIANQVVNDPASSQIDIAVPLTGNTVYMNVTTNWANGGQYTRSYEYQTVADSDGMAYLTFKMPILYKAARSANHRAGDHERNQ